MPIFTYRDLTKLQVLDAVDLSNMAYADEPLGSWWRPLTPGDLGLDADNFEGKYFRGDASLGWGSARALPVVSADGKTMALSFRGTDSPKDYLNFPDVVFFDNYVKAFAPLLDAMSEIASGFERILFTGHSLGAGAVNQLRNVAATEFGGAFKGAYFVAVATPLVSDNADILNIGFENDWVYKSAHQGLVSSERSDFSGTTNDLVWYDANYDKEHFAFDLVNHLTAHGIGMDGPYQTAVERIINSVFYDTSNRGGALPEMSRDTAIIIDGFKGDVADKDTVSSNHFGEPAFILGSPFKDVLIGGPASDGIEGGDGNDRIEGGGDRDYLFGGDGNNTILGEDGNDSLSGGSDKDTLNGGPGNDYLFGAEGNDLLIGDSGDDVFVPYTGNDSLIGGAGIDYVSYFSGSWLDFNISSSSNKKGLIKATIVHDRPGSVDYGTDKMSGVEYVDFSDGLYDLKEGRLVEFGALLTPAVDG